MDFLIQYVNWLLGILPDSPVQAFLEANILDFFALERTLSIVNYFIPLYILNDLLKVWVPSMVGVGLFYVVKNEIGD